jgi:hypothetical protein
MYAILNKSDKGQMNIDNQKGVIIIRLYKCRVGGSKHKLLKLEKLK